MQNRNLTRYNLTDNFILYKNSKKVLSQIVKETGFKALGEIRRATVYDSKKVRNIVYKGRYDGKDAVLKINDAQVDGDEAQLIRAFERQNKSKLIRTPEIYFERPWDKKKGYSYIIFEQIKGRPLYDVPFATPEQMKD